ncbi:MAG: AhpC/TSA family protein [Bacteroidales bacterium]|nr:AhpC/TSA family protein [Bacteroidales bacterium]
MRSIWILLAALAVTACASDGTKNYTVSGTFTENGSKVYLIDQLTETAIGSAVVSDGKFSFRGTAAQDALLAVQAENKNWMTQFFNDGTPVVINVNDSTLKGSPLNERLARLEVEMDLPQRHLNAMIAGLTDDEIMARADEFIEAVNKRNSEQLAFANRVFEEERNSLIPVAFSGYYFLDNGVEAYDELVKEGVVFANHPYLKKTRDDVEALLKPEDSPKTAFVGQPYTDMEMADPDGKMHKISELVGDGKYVLVDFWASWCAPCRAEMPHVLEAYNQFHIKGFEVVGISFDENKEAWVKAIDQLEMPWLQISDLKGFNCAAASIYQVDAIPDNILIDPQGKIIDRGLRGKALFSRLQELIGE